MIEIRGGETRLSIWKADLRREGSFDEVISGCNGVFHLATPMDFESKDPEVLYSPSVFWAEISLVIRKSFLLFGVGDLIIKKKS